MGICFTIYYHNKNDKTLTKASFLATVAAIVIPIILTLNTNSENFARAQRLIEQRNPEEAITILNQILSQNPRDIDAIIEKGRANFSLSKYQEAAQNFREVISLDSTNTRAWYGLGLSSEKLEEPLEALHAYDRAIEWQKESEKRDEKINRRKQLLSLRSDSNYWFSQGETQYEQKDYWRALSAYDAAIELEGGENPEARYGKAWSLIGLNRYEDANLDLDFALTSNIQESRYWYAKGYALHNLGRYKEALTSFDKAINFNIRNQLKGDAGDWNMRGVTLEKLEWYSAACVSYKNALDRDPGLKDAKESLDKLIQIKPEYCSL